MYALRRSAARLLTARPSTYLPTSRSFISVVAPPTRAIKPYPTQLLARRWNTTDSQVEEQAPRPTETSEVENEAQSSSETPSEPSPAIAESANLTEATEEYNSAAETGERPSPTQGIVADGTFTSPSPQDAKPGLFAPKPTIYIGNLFFDVTESDLVKEFTRFGTVSGAKIIRDSRGLSKGFAYLDFVDVNAAQEAVTNMNMQLYEGRRMTVQFAARPSQGNRPGRSSESKPLNPPSKTLFIGNMSFEMTDRDLSNLFRGIRNVVDVRVAIDRRTGQPRGFAHADFIDVKSAMEGMKVLEQKETYGRKLRLDFSYSSNQAPKNNPSGQVSNQGPSNDL
ncbi:hypothetical protein PV10_07643 [Exophiala mesophila]|uniref:RRM domain-containing protein n=1 Tax=Exophiala mesophila TaxID=212818 RepID=A0A0D1WMT2_EXOME|nr:uncharacterized protein PV10_07643 [Exophiala mesophila]KIV90330.1 hypothetical protein PV10_07643 [Exophiala mesophila]